MVACFMGHLDVVRLLLQRGADACRSALDGSTPLMAACRSRSPFCVLPMVVGALLRE